jgi:hypothetical protein
VGFGGGGRDKGRGVGGSFRGGQLLFRRRRAKLCGAAAAPGAAQSRRDVVCPGRRHGRCLSGPGRLLFRCLSA